MAEITGAPPPALAARPEILPGLGPYLEAFSVLCGARATGLGGPLPIPLSEIESYCRLTGWREPESVAELVAVIQAMDAAYLEVTAARGLEPAARPDLIAGGQNTRIRSSTSVPPSACES